MRKLFARRCCAILRTFRGRLKAALTFRGSAVAPPVNLAAHGAFLAGALVLLGRNLGSYGSNNTGPKEK
jgi:hypothetical protein